MYGIRKKEIDGHIFFVIPYSGQFFPWKKYFKISLNCSYKINKRKCTYHNHFIVNSFNVLCPLSGRKHLDVVQPKCTVTVHSKCINAHTLRSDISLPKCPTHSREMSDKFESTPSYCEYLVENRGCTPEYLVERESGYLNIFFYISRGEHVKHFVIDVYL